MLTAKQVIESMETRYMPTEAPAGYTMRVHITLRGSDSSTYTVHVADGKCTVTPGHVGAADATLKADADTYAQVAQGKARVEWAVLRGKIAVSPIPKMREFTKLFRPPTG